MILNTLVHCLTITSWRTGTNASHLIVTSMWLSRHPQTKCQPTASINHQTYQWGHLLVIIATLHQLPPNYQVTPSLSSTLKAPDVMEQRQGVSTGCCANSCPTKSMNMTKLLFCSTKFYGSSLHSNRNQHWHTKLVFSSFRLV